MSCNHSFMPYKSTTTNNSKDMMPATTVQQYDRQSMDIHSYHMMNSNSKIVQSSSTQSAMISPPTTDAPIQLPSISSLLSDMYSPVPTPIATAAMQRPKQFCEDNSKTYSNIITITNNSNGTTTTTNNTPPMVHAFNSTTSLSCTAIPTNTYTSSPCNNYYSSSMMGQHPSSPHHSAQENGRYSSLFSVYPSPSSQTQLYRENSIWEGTSKKPIFFTTTNPRRANVDQSIPTTASRLVNVPARVVLPNVTNISSVPIACKTVNSNHEATTPSSSPSVAMSPISCSNTNSSVGARNSTTLTAPNSNVLDESGFSHSSNVSIIGNDVKSNSSSFDSTACSSEITKEKKQVRAANSSPNVEVLKKVASACIKRGKDNEDSDGEEHDIPSDYSKQKIGKLRLKSSVKGDLASKNKNGSHKGWWTEEEHQRFLEGLEACGNNWKLIAEKYVKTRSRTQVASHGQKWKQSQGLIA